MRDNRAWRILLFGAFFAIALRPAAAQPLTDTVPFSFPENGGVVLTPTPGAMINVGYVKVQTTAPIPTPNMTEVLGFRAGGILVNETVFPTAPLISIGRLYVRLTGSILTGASFANPNNLPVTVSYFFTDSGGIDTPPGNFQISANAKTALFFNQAPFTDAPSAGTMTFSSTAAISVVGIRGFFNERGDFLLTPLPATPLPYVSTETAIVPHWADGTGYANRVILMNTTDAMITGSAQFLLGSGPAATLTVNGSSNTSFAYSIPPRSSVELLTSNGPGLQTGSIRITPTNGDNSPAAFSIISYKPSTITHSEGVFPAVLSGMASRIYVENANANNLFGGVVVANPSPTQVDAMFTLTTLAGAALGSPVIRPISGNGQTAHLMSDLFPGLLPSNLQGILRVSTSAILGVVTSGLRFRLNERSDALLSGVPAMPETGSADTVLPHVVVGGGWNSQIALFSRASGAMNSGIAKFLAQTGAPMPIMDVTPPTVSVTNPIDNATLTGTLNVTADAADNVTVAGVQFLLDGLPLGAEDLVAPYSFQWNSNGTPNGSHVVSADARDAAGNHNLATGVMVKLSNAVRRSQITSQ